MGYIPRPFPIISGNGSAGTAQKTVPGETQPRAYATLPYIKHRRRIEMKCWTLVATVAMVAVLTACSNSNTTNPANETVRTVPTSPNAAYQTTFPVPGATDVTVLEGRLPGSEPVADQPGGGGPVESPTPDAAPVVTAGVNEEETPSPVTIDVDGTRATETPAP